MSKQRTRATSFGKHLYESFVTALGYPLAVLSLIATGLTFAFSDSDNKMLIAIIVLVGCSLVCTVFALFHAAYTAWNILDPSPPKVLSVAQASPPYPESKTLLVIEQRHAINVDTEISIFSMANGMEILIGVGRVIQLQSNGNYLVLASPVGKSVDESTSTMRNSTKDNLEAMVVRPGVSQVVRAFSNGS